MIKGVGVDIVEVARISLSLERWGDRFVHRILTAGEQQSHATDRGRYAWVARQFAAKEAVSKALGTGMSQGVHFRQIEVLRLPSGAPFIRLSGRAKEVAEEFGMLRFYVSISDEKDYAIAYVIAEG